MNLLAHLFLTRAAHPEIMVGNFIADRVKGKKHREYPPKVAHGILIHRSIDSYTDAHPITMESKKLLHPYHGKWAGVVIDILNDHFLATEWHRYSSGESLEEFSERMHRTLQDQRKHLSNKDGTILDHMIQDAWLLGYRERQGLQRAFEGLSRRTGEKGLKRGVSTLDRMEKDLRERFLLFFPELIERTEKAIAHETDETRSPSDREKRS